jgi:hypothetical protein
MFGYKELWPRRSKQDAVGQSSQTRVLWHATTTTVVPASPQPFTLQAPSQHGGLCGWDAAVAPRHLIYLGDAVSLVFANRALSVHGGVPVLLEVEVAEHLLQPDPAYLVARDNLTKMGHTKFGADTLSSLYWSGRVATTGPVNILARYRCSDIGDFLVGLLNTALGDHTEKWFDDAIWQAAASRANIQFKSGSDWRAHIGTTLTNQCFLPF